MFSFLTQSLEGISNTLAPPPTDAASRFVYCVQRDDEAGALACVGELPGAGAIVHVAKGQMPLHVACQSSMTNLIRTLLHQPGASLDLRDAAGNTPLHTACLSTKPNVLDVVKMLVAEYKAPVTAKNYRGETAYDVATVGSVRQYLLPIQLQKETQDALDNGGVGLPPGIDLGGLKINNPNFAPPPSGGMLPGMPGPDVAPGMPPPGSGSGPLYGMPAGMPPPPGSGSLPGLAGMPPSPYPVYGGLANMPPAPMSGSGTVSEQFSATPGQSPIFTPPAHARDYLPTGAEPANPTPAPSSGQHEYALTGSSSAAIYQPPRRGIMPDGFHSSSSDKRLQQKYGHHSTVSAKGIPPPPKSGEAPLSGNSPVAIHPSSAPPSLNAGYRNPYASGGAFSGPTRPMNQRYVAVDPVTGQSLGAPPPPAAVYGQKQLFATPLAANANYTMFNPAAAQTPVAPAPASVPAAASGPVQSSPHQYQSTFATPPAPGVSPSGVSGSATVSPSQSSSLFPLPPNQQLRQPAWAPVPGMPTAAVATSGVASTSPFPQPPATHHQNHAVSAPPSLHQQPTLQQPTPASSPQPGGQLPAGAQLFVARSLSAESAASIFSEPSTNGTPDPASRSRSISAESAESVFSTTPSNDGATAPQQASEAMPQYVGQQTETKSASNLFSSTPSTASFSEPSQAIPQANPMVQQVTRDTSDASNASSLFATSSETAAATADGQADSNETMPPPVRAGGDDEEELMDDIPLSPDLRVNSVKQPVDSTLYSAIGMPPPPFQRK